MKLACACGFVADDGDAFATHLAETGHGMDVNDLKDSGGFAELAAALDQIRTGAVQGTPIDIDDPDVPQEVRDAFAQLMEQRKK